MKKIIIALFATIMLVIVLCGCAMEKQNTNADFLRIHIRANSNSDVDQSVKYDVKNSIVKYLTGKFDHAKTKSQAIKIVNDNLDEITEIANKTLKEKGFTYSAKAVLREEEFPARKYDELLLPSDVYDALIVELGSASGDNWWCVVFPPLCFLSDDSEMEYKSIIYEWYKKLTNKES